MIVAYPFLKTFMDFLSWLVAILTALVTFALYGSPATHQHIDGPDEEDETLTSMYLYKPTVYPGAGYSTSIYGRTRYYVFGNPEGKRVVLVHGISVPCVIFKPLAKALADAGYCVLTYDLYGRGYSDAPGVLYDEALHTMQLYLLLQHMEWTKCHVVGLSMGGGIATSFSHHYPDVVQSLTLLAPAGLMAPQEINLLGQVIVQPGVGSVFAGLLQKLMQFPLAYSTLSNQFPQNAEFPLRRVVLDQIRLHKGFTRAVASSLRHYPLTKLHDAYHAVGKHTYPVMVVWGDQDTIVPYEACATRLTWHIPRAKLHIVPGAGHNAVFTHGDFVGALLVQFLNALT
jgi:pimeloyl-ACP methyl ester carboxylesterase